MVKRKAPFEGVTVFVISLQGPDAEAESIKYEAMRVLSKVVDKAGAGTVRLGSRMAMFAIPTDREGSWGRFAECGLKYVDMVGTRGPEAAERRADALLAKLEENGGSYDDVGVSTVQRCLDTWMMAYERMDVRNPFGASAPLFIPII